MKLKALSAVLFATVAAVSTGCSSPSTEHTEASYPQHYDTVTDLQAHSTLVVEVTAKDMSHTHREGGTQAGGSVLLTDSAVTVDRVLYDPRHQVSDTTGKITVPTVVIYQTGGGKGADSAIEDDPIFKKGEHMVLFLRDGTVPLHYVQVGGPNGRFTAANGKIAPFNAVSVQFTGAEDGLASTLHANAPAS